MTVGEAGDPGRRVRGDERSIGQAHDQGCHPHPATISAGAEPLAPTGDRVLAGDAAAVRAVSGLPVAGKPDRHHGAVRALARSHPRLRRHCIAWPRRLLRHRRLYGGIDLEIRLGRAVDRAHFGGRGRRARRLCRELHRLALPPLHADHDHARPRAACLRGGEPRALAHRRQRRFTRRLDLAGARHLQVRSLWLHRLRLFAGNAFCRVPRRAPPGEFAIRSRAARHPRKLGAHAGDRRRQPRAYPQGFHACCGDCRACRRGAGADHGKRLARIDQLSSAPPMCW